MDGNNLAGASLAGQNLTSADFSAGFHPTSSYNAGANLTGANLSQANLTNANFSGHYEESYGLIPGANLTGANLSGADARGATFDDPASTIAANRIRENGQIYGLGLNAGQLLVVRDYDGDSRSEPSRPPIPITIDQLTIGPGGTLRMVFEADAWNSTISFAPGIPVALGGVLELAFASGVEVTVQCPRTIDLFDWTFVNPTGVFAVASPYSWDFAKLYTTGEITLLPTRGFQRRQPRRRQRLPSVAAATGQRRFGAEWERRTRAGDFIACHRRSDWYSPDQRPIVP